MNPSYADEEKIVWLVDRDRLAGLGLVREKVLLCSIRTGPVRAPPGEALIGYAVLKKSAAKEPGGGFLRRIFTLERLELYGRSEDLIGSLPSEAIDPLSVRPGNPGRRLSKEE